MADSAVPITAGSGTNVDTRTESTNGNHRQVVVLGDPAANDSVAAVKAASTAPVATDPALVVAISPNSVNANGPTAGANSAPVVLPTDMTAVPVAPDTSKLMNGAANVALTPKFASIAVSSSGDNSIVALVATKKIRVLSLKLTANGAVNAKWRSNTTDKTGLSYFAAAGDGEVLPFNQCGWFETAAGEALNLNLSGAVAVGGHISYVEV